MRVIIIEDASEATIRSLMLNQGMQMAMIRSASPIAEAKRVEEVLPELEEAEREQLTAHAQRAIESRHTPMFDSEVKRVSISSVIEKYFSDHPNDTSDNCISMLMEMYKEKYSHLTPGNMRARHRVNIGNTRIQGKIISVGGTGKDRRYVVAGSELASGENK
jgi:hypothetical protein